MIVEVPEMYEAEEIPWLQFQGEVQSVMWAWSRAHVEEGRATAIHYIRMGAHRRTSLIHAHRDKEAECNDLCVVIRPKEGS